MAKSVKVGDKVERDSSGGHSTGVLKKSYANVAARDMIGGT